MKKHLVLIQVFCLFFATKIFPQSIDIQKIEPTNWWVGMKNPRLQLLVYGTNISAAQFSVKYTGITVEKVQKVENPNYLFIDLYIGNKAPAGIVALKFTVNGKALVKKYELRQKAKDPLANQGLSPADLIYLIMPDRFSNGDSSNDKFANMTDTTSDRKNPYLRHGGDLQGIINHLDYIKNVGVTALWLNPVVENDEPLLNEGGKEIRMQAGYHGYHFTDHYAIDRRLGGNQAYHDLVNEAHKHGLKIVQDAVYNHISEHHWLYKDLPEKSWINQWATYTGTNHKEYCLPDPYAAQVDKKQLLDGWFTPFLPDLNQKNPLMATYLIQNAVWMTQEFGLDAWRIDTYKYNDMEFMNRCNAALVAEFPKIFLFGESVSNTVPNQSYFVKNTINQAFKCNLMSTCDFVACRGMWATLNEPYGWSEGISRIYQILAQDFLYEKPELNVTFLDNHDEDRFFSIIGENINKYKQAIVWLLTSRGIPQIYYGTEFLTKSFKKPTDAEVRKDFPGGFANDTENKFIATGRTTQENEAFDFVQKLANYRKNTPALHSGKFMQFIPEQGVYVYFRYNTENTIMVVLNTNQQAIELPTARFEERINGFAKARNILTDALISNLSVLSLAPSSAMVLELEK